MATFYMLGVKKLLRMVNDHLNGNNILKISIDQDPKGNQEVIIFLDKENLSKGDGQLDDPIDFDMGAKHIQGAERMCPVPPGCDDDGDCKARAENHLIGNAKSYALQSDTNELRNSSKESMPMNNEAGLQLDNRTITFTIKAVDTAE